MGYGRFSFFRSHSLELRRRDDLHPKIGRGDSRKVSRFCRRIPRRPFHFRAELAVTKSIFALLGRRDEPTDAVEEYCKYLGAALTEHGFQLEIRRVPWDSRGWGSSLEALQLMAASWRDRWVLVQYTALAWSVRGFPGKFERVLYTLAKAGARIGVVYHDVEPYSGERLVDHARRFAQVRTMRSALRFADAAIFTVPLEQIVWIARSPDNAHFIPVGPNLPVEGSAAKA